LIKLSIIIPFFDSSQTLRKYLPKILERISHPSSTEVLLVDATGFDGHSEFCSNLGVKHIATSSKGRSLQMNLGANQARADWLFFLHIDSIPPPGFDQTIITYTHAESGCFQLQFDWNHWFLNFFAWLTRFYWVLARGGDQGLFIRQSVFNELNGYKEIPIMEDIDMCRRLFNRKTFIISDQKILTSARKYKQQGAFRLQIIFGWITLLYWLGWSPGELKKIYDKNIR